MNSLFKIFIFSLITLCYCATADVSFANNYDDNQFENEFFEDFAYLQNNKQKNNENDPLEPVNRTIFVFNETFDKYFFEHVARTYRLVIPKKARSSIRNFLDNLSKPISLVNSIVQGKLDNSLATLSSFLINSTVGIFGLFDVADANGIRYEQEDLGQTLGYYGTGPGIYLVIPFGGPSSLRDFAGWAVDRSVDPIGFNILRIGNKKNFVDGEYRAGIGIMSSVDSRERLLNTIEEIRNDSFDPYVTMRSAYLQNRIEKIKR
ncbi:MAG: VacJ family lipoprotein [Rickettsiales bacterium]|nr:VacJ family lipoprotein [Rickettsiales bacterium]